MVISKSQRKGVYETCSPEELLQRSIRAEGTIPDSVHPGEQNRRRRVHLMILEQNINSLYSSTAKEKRNVSTQQQAERNGVRL
jgi:hypothetical protein